MRFGTDIYFQTCNDVHISQRLIISRWLHVPAILLSRNSTEQNPMEATISVYSNNSSL